MTFPKSVRSQALLVLANGDPIDYAVHPPPSCNGRGVTIRPCPKTACRYHLWPQDERPGRPHQPGARPPVTLRRDGPSCMYDEIATNPDGLTSDDVGQSLGIVGERVRQLEHRGALKWEAVTKVIDHIEAVREVMPQGSVVDAVYAHNEHAMPNQHFVTVVITVDPKQDKRERKAFSGVMVRKRRAR